MGRLTARPSPRRAALLGAILGACACESAGPAARGDPASAPAIEAKSLLGAELVRPELPAERRAQLERDLADAQAAFDADPRGEDEAIWLGRRLAYLGRFRDAIDVFSRALAIHPESSKLLRHRGHRHLTVRRLDAAIADLARAAELIRGTGDEIEPDGAPNAAGVPRSTHHSNVRYHLALARYVRGDFERALDAWIECETVSRVNDDMLCAASWWLWLTAKRLGREEVAARALAPIRPEMQILENFAYHELLLDVAAGVDPLARWQARTPGTVDFATFGYGAGAFSLLRGDRDEARRRFRLVVDAGPWPAFGALAAEAELARK